MGEVRKWVNKGVGDKRTKINEEKKIIIFADDRLLLWKGGANAVTDSVDGLKPAGSQVLALDLQFANSALNWTLSLMSPPNIFTAAF